MSEKMSERLFFFGVAFLFFGLITIGLALPKSWLVVPWAAAFCGVYYAGKFAERRWPEMCQLKTKRKRAKNA